MPYTLEELQGIDFYQEFTNEKLIKYFKRIGNAAAKRDGNDNPIPFKKDGVDYVSFEDVETGLGLEEGDFNSDIYNLLVSSIHGNTRTYFLSVLNAEFNAFMSDTSNLGGFSAGMTPDDIGAPIQYTAGDIPSFIRELLETKGKHRGYYPNYKNSKLEGIIDRNIDELSTSEVAVTLPEGVSNGNVVTTEKVDDIRKWLIANNQKRLFPTIESFWGTSHAFSSLITVAEVELNKIPNGDPVD